MNESNGHLHVFQSVARAPASLVADPEPRDSAAADRAAGRLVDDLTVR